MQNQLIHYLYSLLSDNAKDREWLDTQINKIGTSKKPTPFFLAFSQASRHFKKEKIELSDEKISTANNLMAGFQPKFWDELQVARTILMLSYPQDEATWFEAMNQLFETADMHEHQALFAALPIMPFQKELTPRAIDGLRTNISSVFDAIALNNPFPAIYFPEANWNQMVLKAIFMQRPLYRIQGLDERRNPALAAIARDFAHERWAAGREVMPEIWRLVVPFLDEEYLKDLERGIASEDQLQLSAAIIAIEECDFPPAKVHLKKYQELLTCLHKGHISWEAIGKEYQLTHV